jgi:hypothetical protein
MNKWTWECDNDVGARDESLDRFWKLYCDDKYIGRVETEAAAVQVTNVLNCYPVLVEGIKETTIEVLKVNPLIRVVYQKLINATQEAANICKESHEKDHTN